jgi:hypothetical protein
MEMADLKVPMYKYFPAHLMGRVGPQQWARLRLLHACERLKIPNTLWPRWPLELPRRQEHVFPFKKQLDLPPFRPLEETIPEWKARCQLVFETFFHERAHAAKEWLNAEVESGRLKKIPPTRNTTALDLRYDWAAKRMCLNVPYKSLATDGYSIDRIKQAVLKIVRETGLGEGR